MEGPEGRSFLLPSGNWVNKVVKLEVNCYLLCAMGFAEESAWHARTRLQAIGIKTPIIGLKTGTLIGSARTSAPVELLISLFIGEEGDRPLPDGLLLAGGQACGNQLLADPRVHRLIEKMAAAERPTGFLQPIFFPLIELLNQKGINQPFWLQERQDTADFMNIFIQQLARVKRESQQVKPT